MSKRLLKKMLYESSISDTHQSKPKSKLTKQKAKSNRLADPLKKFQSKQANQQEIKKSILDENRSILRRETTSKSARKVARRMRKKR